MESSKLVEVLRISEAIRKNNAIYHEYRFQLLLLFYKVYTGTLNLVAKLTGHKDKSIC